MSSETWNPGKFGLSVRIETDIHTPEENDSNNGLNTLVHVVPSSEDLEHANKLLQIISPREGLKQKKELKVRSATTEQQNDVKQQPEIMQTPTQTSGAKRKKHIQRVREVLSP